MYKSTWQLLQVPEAFLQQDQGELPAAGSALLASGSCTIHALTQADIHRASSPEQSRPWVQSLLCSCLVTGPHASPIPFLSLCSLQNRNDLS